MENLDNGKIRNAEVLPKFFCPKFFDLFTNHVRAQLVTACTLKLFKMEELTKESCIRGYHIYKYTWEPVIGENLACEHERNNGNDRYAVAVKKNIIVGHMPKKISRISSLFLKRGGVFTCIVTAGRRHSADLSQGGLEIPCTITFKASNTEMMTKLKALLY